MTGPEHYCEAQRLIDEANHVGHSDPQRGGGMIAAAQVHATLAVAAATALRFDLPPGDSADWLIVASAGLIGVIDQGDHEVTP